VAAFGDPPPILVLTGGDPLRRPDIVDLVAHARRRGVMVSLTPSGTASATEAKLRALRDAGLSRLAVSLDGATAPAHDAFRGVRGSHGHTMRILERASALGLPLQVNTTVCRQTVDDLPALVPQLRTIQPVLWALFFLIPVGRARGSQALSAGEIEDVLRWAAALAESAPFGVKTTEAPHYLRVTATRHRIARLGSSAHVASAGAPGVARPDAIGRAGRAVTDGNGFVFIDHLGHVCPSGFLPIPVASVRERDLVTVYREDPLFRALRDPARLGGRCGRCEYRERCGGSRARAYAVTGDPLAEDPGCAYDPAVGRARPSPARAIAGGSDVVTGVRPERITEALRTVLDPELGLSVVDLGLVYGVAIEGGAVRITMTLTAPGCPLHGVLTDWVRRAVLAIPGVDRVDVALTFDPPWTPARMESH
jgi:MoaA/NifB/PqqE/SkfB family radical SAM enzyme/metal-sulfur cluster biosynthetic enzyme